MRDILAQERGSITAEFAVVLPAVLVTLGLIIGGVMLASVRLSLVSAAFDLARLEARGDSSLIEARLSQLPVYATVQREYTDGMVCVTLQGSPGSGILSSVRLSARGCALAHSEPGAVP